MSNIHRILGIALVCSAFTLVGCGGGGGGGGDSSSKPAETKEITSHGTPDVGPVANNDEDQGSDPSLLGPVNNDDDQLALVSNDEPGHIAANPEPATIALGAVGGMLLLARRYRRKA